MSKKQFTLDSWLKDKSQKVVTRCGFPVRIVCTDVKRKDYPILALVERDDQEEYQSFTKDGRFSLYNPLHDNFDLFIETADEVSEDEKVREELIKHLKEGAEGYEPAGDSSDYQRWLAWVEKQGKTSPVLSNFSNIGKDEQKPLGYVHHIDEDGYYTKEAILEPNPYTGTGFDYNGHHWGMCARDGGVEILMDGNITSRVFPDKNNIIEQKPTDSYCQENCKGFQETGKCFADGECKAKREAEQNLAENAKPQSSTPMSYGKELEKRMYEACNRFFAPNTDSNRYSASDLFYAGVKAERDLNTLAWSEEDEPKKELAKSYLAKFDEKFPILPTLKGMRLADYKNFLNKCQQIFGLRYWGFRPLQAKLFEKLSLLWAAWGAEHLQGLGQTDGDMDDEISMWSEEDKGIIEEAVSYLINYSNIVESKEDSDRIEYLIDKIQDICPHQKQAWSEEDEQHIDSLLKRLDALCRNKFERTRFAISEDREWLKSLRPQNTYNPYKAVVESIAEMCKHYDKASHSGLRDFYDNVKVKCKDAQEYDKMFPQAQWKPSDVQMGCLSDAIEYYNSLGYPAPKLKELLDDLKKLKEGEV